MKELYEANKKTIHKLIWVIGFALLIYLFVNYLFTYVAPFVLGYVLSLAMEPLARFIQKKTKLSRSVTAIICVMALILGIGAIGTGLVMRIVTEASSFFEQLPDYIKEVSGIITSFESSSFEKVFSFIPEEFHQTVVSLVDSLLHSITQSLGSGVKSGTGTLVTVVPGFIMVFVLTFVSLFFFIKDKALISQTVRRFMPKSMLIQFAGIKSGIFSALGGYVKTQLILMAFTGTICIIGLSILRYPYALFLGLIIALIDALPIFGSGFVIWPWTVFNLLTKNFSFAIGLMIIYGTIILVRQLLEPRILGKQIGIHPLLTLMAMYMGMKIFGILGFIIGPVSAVIIKVILKTETEQ